METVKQVLGFLNTVTDVTIVANEKLEGNPIVTPMMDNNNNPRIDLNDNELGSIRLEQNSRSLNGSYLNNRKRVAFIAGPIDELEKLVASEKLKHGSKIPGKILIIESLTPMWKGQNPKINPSSGDAIEIAVGERKYPVFMKMIYTEDVTKQDHLIRTAEDVIYEVESMKLLADVTQKGEAAGIPTT
jgi:hypothetical protein